ncbi:hypothetical protein [Brevundimonas sp. Root1279]|uniref:hypothetical protein n=1 Tax=Brevundimonas sp. Root1279 TaxID=1736443 RepID=UPI0006F22212|nr:hypothetical protein [Brevundimonas sp. Root1279]KQW79702.1 hypothetical protein ASC65_14230 [Brevundimonas sp. Root1279]
MTDTPVQPPVGRLERLKVFIGDLARPYVLIAVGTATAKVIWVAAPEGVIFAAGGTLAVLYGAKAAETAFGAKKAADVEVAKTPTP